MRRVDNSQSSRRQNFVNRRDAESAEAPRRRISNLHLFFPLRRLRGSLRLGAGTGVHFLLILIILHLSPIAVGQAKKFDVVVYGGTAGGVMTAVSAAREGLTVAVVEPSKHLGGMVTGGLSRTDYGKKEVIGGMAL